MPVGGIVSALRGLLPQIGSIGRNPVARTTRDAFLGGGAFPKGRAAQWAKEHPVIAGLSALGAVGLGSEVVPPVVRGVHRDWSNHTVAEARKELESEKDMQAIGESHRLRQESVERELAKQSARLAAANPHLYNQIMAGRRLPQGAVILGGNPRTDLMEQIAGGMASNPQLQQQGPAMGPQDQFLNELGV
jgi:hypothetical protein